MQLGRCRRSPAGPPGKRSVQRTDRGLRVGVKIVKNAPQMGERGCRFAFNMEEVEPLV